MARIPIYTQQIGVPRNTGAGPLGQVPQQDFGGGDIARLGQVGERAAMQIANVEQRKQEEDAAAWSAEQMSNARLHWTQQQIEREQNAPAGASGYTGTLSKDFDSYADEALRAAPTEASRNYLRQRFTDLKTSLVGRGMEFEARSRLNDRLTKIDNSLDQSRIAVDLDPSQYQSTLAEQIAAITALDLPEQKKQEIAQKAQQALSVSSVNARLRHDPYGVLKQLGDENGGGALDIRGLSADARLRLRNDAEGEIKRRESEARQAAAISRAELAYRAQDAVAGFMQGLDVKGAPTQGEYIAAYGAEKGQQMYDSQLRAQSFGNDVQQFATLPIDQRMDFLKQRQPGANGITAGEGFAEQQQIYGQLVKNAQSLNKQMADDGAGYAIKYAPEVANAWQGVMTNNDPEQTPSVYQAYAEAALGEQTRLGIPQPTILPESYVAQVTSAFKDPANAGPKQLELINELKRNWGQHYPQVMRQLYKTVPDSVKIIASGSVDKDTATILSTIAPVDTKDLKAPLAGPDVSMMTESLKPALAQFGRTFAAQGQAGSSTYASIVNEASRGAMYLMQSGKSPSEAAEEMATRLTANYQVDGTLRVPKEWDIDTVQQGAHVAVSRLTANDIALDEIKGVSGEFTDQRLKALLNSANLVTNKNEDGVYLTVNGGAVLGKNGLPLEFKFDDLLGVAGETVKQEIPASLRYR